MTDPSRSRERLGLDADSRWFGVYIGVVTGQADGDHPADPLGQGRVRVRFPWAPSDSPSEHEPWCRVATLMAGHLRGTWFVPDIGDEVLVCFEAGDPRRPFVLGSLWNGVDRPPEQGTGANHIRTIRTQSGIRIRMDDTPGAPTLVLETGSGQRVRLADGDPTVTVEDASGNRIVLDAGDNPSVTIDDARRNRIVLAGNGITIESPDAVDIRADTVDVTARQVSVHAEATTFSGSVHAASFVDEGQTPS